MKNKFAGLLDDDTIDPLDQPAGTVAPKVDHTLSIKVPNLFPRFTNQPYKIAIVGESPGLDEIEWCTCEKGHEFCRILRIPPKYEIITRSSCPTCFSSNYSSTPKPFVGTSGRELTRLMSAAGILRDAVFLGNVCQRRPAGNDISNFEFQGPEIQEGLAELKNDLSKFNPNICILLGKTALFAAKGTGDIGNWRGSLFISETQFFNGFKCIASYHPAACLRNYEWTPLLYFDLRKGLRNATTASLTLPQRNLITDPTVEQILDELSKVKRDKPTIALDIEGYVDAMSCLSIATSPTHCFIVPFMKRSGASVWNVDDETQIWKALVDVLSDPTIPKVLQNSLYDRFVLQYSYGLVVRGVTEDTMLKSWEQYCELEKSLGFQCSIYTDQPYYKFEGKSGNQETFWRYCCMDSAVTYEIAGKLEGWLHPQGKAHYKLNVALLNPLLYMELRGIKYDLTLAAQRSEQVKQHVLDFQTDLDKLSGRGINPNLTKAEILQLVQQLMCYKKNPTQPKKDYIEVFPKILALLTKPEPLTPVELSFIAVESDLSLNIRSSAFKDYLYGTLKLPTQYKKDPKTGLQNPSTDYISLLKLRKVSPHPVVEIAIQLGSLRTRSQMLEISADKDGRVRAGYNIVGTETGRLTCYTSPTGSGYNLQTIPSEDKQKPEGHPLRNGMRDLFVADEGCWMFQCDLSGADGWTIGAHLNSIGDPTMLLDLRNKIKPAAAICYMLRHGNQSLNGKTREEIKVLLKEVKGSDWDYFVCKQGIWGTCYLMGPDLLALLVAMASEGKHWLSRSEVRDFQEAVFTRYKVKFWHAATSRKLSSNPELTSASGFKRRFFGRSQEILGQALAHEPQANTTYATNLAMYRLWTDSDNRVHNTETNHLRSRSCVLRIEPLHQVHDALLGQFKKEDTFWAVDKIKSYFNNEITIAGQRIVIPFEGNYGESWGNLKEGTI